VNQQLTSLCNTFQLKLGEVNMIVFILLTIPAPLILGLRWIFKQLSARSCLFIISAGLGWGGYGVLGTMIPHIDPQIWHYLSAPAIGGLALVVGWMMAKARGYPV
jgi:hypothetical protein